MKVIIIGAGYVGLISGLCYAKLGHHVCCVDVDSEKTMLLLRGTPSIYEKDLEPLLQEQLKSERIKFMTEVPQPACFDIGIIAVGTPSTVTGAADLSAVFGVATELANKLQYGAIIGIKSTVPAGTAAKINEICMSIGRSDISVVSMPEFLREGSAINDALSPYRLVFGVPDHRSENLLRELHSGIDAPIVVCASVTAELIKYASNAFLATKISFINEIANISERIGANVVEVAYGMGLDPRIGPHFLKAGLGYGGSCFPKDTRALVNIAGDVDYEFHLLKSVVVVNQLQKLEPLKRLRTWLGSLSHKRITLLGVAFKPGTDDVRESPALDLANAIREEGGGVSLCDPIVRSVQIASGETLSVSEDAYGSLCDADAAILVTEWDYFLTLDWSYARSLMRAPFLFDGRNVLEPKKIRSAGFILGNFGNTSVVVSEGGERSMIEIAN